MEKVKSFCNQCQKESGFTPSAIKHKLHLLVSFITFGAWLPMWFILNLARKWVCDTCGYDVKPFKHLQP